MRCEMAKIVEKQGTKITDTFCEHMEYLPFLNSLCEYCSICGQKLHGEEPMVRKVCSDCGKPVVELKTRRRAKFTTLTMKAYYCAFCGGKFDGSEEVEEVKK